MGLYSDESLNTLRTKIDLVEVLSSHIELKRAGAAYKALCPFHEEKTPSFVLQAGDDHYHCFGCGAHGDAIAFLMSHVKMTFVEAVESLAERFGVRLEKSEEEGRQKGPDRAKLKEALELAAEFYHTYLLHTDEGHQGLQYLYRRGIDLEFIKAFRIGWAPAGRKNFFTFAKGENISEEILLGAGLITQKGNDFFSDRITFPITDSFGNVIGFSARKIKEETFGGKYINTSETPLFKKSHILFGLSFCRQRMAKEKKAIIVEGQMDALRLIHAGCNLAVAGQGTAFGDGHVKLLSDLGVSKVFLAMDGDGAGAAAAIKIGNLFQKKGMEVSVLALPHGGDPDNFVQKNGIDAFYELMEEAGDYLNFIVSEASKETDLSNPAQKSEMIQKLSDQIRSWDQPVLVHESLRKLSELTRVPESVVGVGASPQPHFVQKMGRAGFHAIDPDRILETDLLRWLILHKEDRLYEIAGLNVAPDLFRNPICRRIFDVLMKEEASRDLISLGSALEDEEEQKLLAEIVQKKVNPDRAESGLVEVVHRLLIRKWMAEREGIKAKIQSGTCSDAEVLQLAKAFDEIKKSQPTVVMP